MAKIVLEKLIVIQLIKKFLGFINLKFMTVVTKVLQKSSSLIK